jgi:hypothetical protein
MENKRKKSDIAFVTFAIVFATLFFVACYLALDYFDLFHTWSIQPVDGTNVKICLRCGEVKELECNHHWKAQKVDGEFVAYCTKCGKAAD